MKILVGYDGTAQSKDALKYGLQKVGKEGGALVALQIFNSGLFVDYDVWGSEELARAEFRGQVEEAKQIIREAGKGNRTSLLVGDGNPTEEIIDYARSQHIDIVLCPTRFKSVIDNLGRREECDVTAVEAAQFEMACVTAPKK